MIILIYNLQMKYNINKDKKSQALKLLSVHKLDFVLKVKCFSAAK